MKETALQEWINRGLLKRIAIYRDPNLTQNQAVKFLLRSADPAEAKARHAHAMSAVNNALNINALDERPDATSAVNEVQGIDDETVADYLARAGPRPSERFQSSPA